MHWPLVQKVNKYKKYKKVPNNRYTCVLSSLLKTPYAQCKHNFQLNEFCGYAFLFLYLFFVGVVVARFFNHFICLVIGPTPSVVACSSKNNFLVVALTLIFTPHFQSINMEKRKIIRKNAIQCFTTVPFFALGFYVGVQWLTLLRVQYSFICPLLFSTPMEIVLWLLWTTGCWYWMHNYLNLTGQTRAFSAQYRAHAHIYLPFCWFQLHSFALYIILRSI